MKRALLAALLALSCTRDESKTAPAPSSPGASKRMAPGRPIPQDGQQVVRDSNRVPGVDGAAVDAGSP